MIIDKCLTVISWGIGSGLLTSDRIRSYWMLICRRLIIVSQFRILSLK